LNTFWLVAACLIFLFAAVFLFVLIPWMRRRQNISQASREGLAALLTASRTPAIAGSAAIILIVIALYLAWSKPDITPSQSLIAQNGQMAPEHIEMINSLKTRLEQNPNDGKGWAMLGRSYAVLGRFNESAEAYEKATNLIPNNPALMVDYADVLAMANGKNLQGKPLDLIQGALKIDPNNAKGLLLIGKAAYQAGDFTHAAGYWEKLLQQLPPDSPLAKQISSNIAQARAQIK
jgi:cytochrome c-type biogenesis protein CcmH